MQQVCTLSDLTEGEIVKIEVDGLKPLAATVLNGVPYVFPERCPHAEESLAEGWVEDGRVVCGVHFAEFGLEDDEVVNRPVGCGHLLKFPAEARADAVFADLSTAEVL